VKKVTDLTIKSWLNERFEGKACGNGLYLVYRKEMATPMWRFRYRLSGKQRQMFISSYKDMTLAEARAKAKELSASVTLGHDVALEKQARKQKAIATREADKLRITVSELAQRYYRERIMPRRKRHESELTYIERLSGYLGKMPVADVTGRDINAMYQKDLARGFPASTNKLREHTIRAFGFAVAENMIPHNPAQWLDASYAGGKLDPRERTLTRDELAALFKEMRECQSFGAQNYLTIKLLLMLGVRKSELIQAKKSEFNLDTGVWALGKERAKTKSGIDIPLPVQAIDLLRQLFAMSDSDYLLPARSAQHNRLPHIAASTLNVALEKIKGIDDFTVHDFRRTAKTLLQSLGVDEFISERCLNHRIKGVAGVYGRHDFFDERKKALQLLANYLESCEQDTDWNVISINNKKAG